MKLDVVKDRVTSLATREAVGSNPTWPMRPVDQWVEHLMSLTGGSRPAVLFEKKGGAVSWKT